jgi:hypothetical protein
MSEISNYLENALINGTLRATTFTAPANIYVGLFTSDPTDAGTGSEVSGGSYARKEITFAAPSNGVTESNADVTFDTATASWGTISFVGLYDALSGGNLLYHTALDIPKVIDTNDIFKINAGGLTVTLS